MSVRTAPIRLLAVAAILALGPATVVRAAEPEAAPAAREATRRIAPLPLKEISARPPRPIIGTPGFELQERKVPARVLKLRLEDLRKAVLEGQLEIRVESITPAIVSEIIHEEEARFNSIFTASFARSNTEDFSNVITRGRSLSIGTTIPLRSGGAISLNMPISSLETAPRTSTAALALNFSQPLLRKAGVRVNTASLEQAKLSAEQAHARAKLSVINYLANADRAYWRHWASWQEVDIRYEQYEMAKTQVHYAEETVKAGLIAKVDIIRSQSGVARRLEDILVAESGRRQIEREIKRIMNRNDLPLGGEPTLMPADEPELLELTLLPEKVLDQAVANRMDLLTAQLQMAIDALDNEVARNQLLPLLSFNLGYTIKNWDNGAIQSLQGLQNNRYPDWNLGLTLEMPFDNSGARARVRRTALQQAASLETVALRQRQIHKDVLDTVDQLNQSWQRILAARNEIRTANEIYQAELEQFRHGMRTSTDVLNAASLIADAKIRNVRATVDYELAKIDIAYATGTTLGYAGVEIKPYQLPD